MAIRYLFIITVITAAALFIVEGVSSFALLWLTLAREASHEGSERIATRHDPLLGWVNIPGKVVKDMFGLGVDVRINSQGFRAERDYPTTAPTDRARVICSGDSFTFGFGVRLDEAWCHRLLVSGRLAEAINMSQIGYGFDQMYLWYQRDGVAFDHDLHVVGTIFYDYTRMLSSRFEGFGKPTLKVEAGRLLTANTPVPKLQYFWPWATRNRAIFQEVRFVALANALLSPPAANAAFSPSEMETVVGAALADLAALNRQKRSRLVLVYLPIERDYETDYTAPWRSFLTRQANAHDFTFLDLTPAFRALSKVEHDSMFIPKGVIPYPGSAGHYNHKGNAFVAEVVSAGLPPIRRQLLSPGPT